jgi:hypothetical protein
MDDAPAHERDPDRHQHRHFHEVAKQPVRSAEQPGAEQRYVEVVAVGAPEHRDDLKTEDREAPEDEEVHPPRRSLADDGCLGAHKLLLSEEVDEQSLNALRNPVEPLHARHAAQHVETAPELMKKEA